jgi:hypothetical protein
VGRLRFDTPHRAGEVTSEEDRPDVRRMTRTAQAVAAVAAIALAAGCSGGDGESDGPGQISADPGAAAAASASPPPGGTGSGRGVLGTRPSAGSRSSAGARLPSGAAADGGSASEVPSSFPNAATTGVPSGRSLKVHNGTLKVTKSNTVVDGLDVRGDIDVDADNVTIKNTRVVTAGNWGIIQRQGARGLRVLDTEVRGNGTDRLQYAVLNQGGMITIQRCDFSITSDPISTDLGLITDNYVHDPKYFPDDHTDMIQSNQGPPAGAQLVIRHNTLINTLEQTAAVALFQDFGVQHDAVIDGNLLAGGGYALYGGAGSMGTAYNIKVINNVFSRQVFPKGGQYGPVAYWDAKGPGNVWQNNVWADTGRPVTP